MAVQSQIFGDDRDRIIADATRAAEDAVAVFASALPAPAWRFCCGRGGHPAEGATGNLEFQPQGGGAVRREPAIRGRPDHQTPQVAMSSAVDYVKALASGPDVASGLINVGYDAQSKLISAASSFYNSRIAAAELVGKQVNSTSGTRAGGREESGG